jgi:hypothetical protein
MINYSGKLDLESNDILCVEMNVSQCLDCNNNWTAIGVMS